MAVTSPPKLDAKKLRADFPIFEQEINGKPLAYLDSAVSTHKPRQVLDKLRDFYETSYANVHRGVYTLSERATAARARITAAPSAPLPPPPWSACSSVQSATFALASAYLFLTSCEGLASCQLSVWFFQ